MGASTAFWLETRCCFFSGVGPLLSKFAEPEKGAQRRARRPGRAVHGGGISSSGPLRGLGCPPSSQGADCASPSPALEAARTKAAHHASRRGGVPGVDSEPRGAKGQIQLAPLGALFLVARKWRTLNWCWRCLLGENLVTCSLLPLARVTVAGCAATDGATVAVCVCLRKQLC